MIYYVRHGKTDWNALHKCQGLADIDLSEEGKQEAKNLQNDVAEVKCDYIFCSPLKRAVQTCEIACEKIDTPFVIDSRLIERDFGEFEGLKRAEFDFNKFWDVKNKQQFLKAESLSDVIKRAEEFLDYLKPISENKNILVFGHAGFGVVFKWILMGKPNISFLEINMENAKLIPIPNNYLNENLNDVKPEV